MFSLTHPNTVIQREVLKTRKDHECAHCVNVVEKGTEAINVDVRYDHKVFHFWMHPECEKISGGWLPVGEEPEGEVFCLAETGEARFGKLQHTESYGWYCQHATGNVYNVTHYSYQLKPE
jgi:hypothetical protein